MTPTSPWSPLQHKVFRALWTAGLAANVGIWMQSVGAAWLMTSLTPSPLMVALIQTASTLPAFLLGLPGGVLADLLDRRRLLLATNVWMMASIVILTLLTLFEGIGPWTLLAITFSVGAGLAIQAPAWMSTASDILPRAAVPAAVTLNGISYNIARALGPAIAGLIIAAWGTSAVFALTALCYVAVVVVLIRWRNSPQRTSNLPPEGLLGGMQTGLRYVRHSPVLLGQIMRALASITCASALWALLPVVARKQLGLDAGGYGFLLTCLGAGAVAGAFVLARLRDRHGPNAVVTFANILFAGVTLCLAYVREPVVLHLALAFGGFAWITMTAVPHAAVQTSLPAWVRARAIAVFLIAFQAAMAIGGVLWGSVASHLGTPQALALAAAMVLVSLIYGRRHPVRMGSEAEVTPSMHWTPLAVEVEPDLADGPVAVHVEYRINPTRRIEFATAAYAMSTIRQRDGATSWRLYKDLSEPSRYIERFVVDSWAEYLRQQARATMADRLAEERVRAFHVGDTSPQMLHFILEPRP